MNMAVGVTHSKKKITIALLWLPTAPCDEVRNERERVYGLGQCVLDTPETSALGRADRD